jgi:hypothetical protein
MSSNFLKQYSTPIQKGIHYIGNKQSIREKVIYKKFTHIVEAINKKSISATACDQPLSLWIVHKHENKTI